LTSLACASLRASSTLATSLRTAFARSSIDFARLRLAARVFDACDLAQDGLRSVLD